MSVVFDSVANRLADLQSAVKQLKFLLASAPMIDAPTEKAWLQASQSPFAYVHPKTFATMLDVMHVQCRPRFFVVFPGSPTKWVLTSLMPEGRVLYSPLAVPGIEKILAS